MGDEAEHVLYRRHAFLPPGQMLVAAPAITGADQDVLLIPTGEQGDRILAGLRELGREPVEWTPTAHPPRPLMFEPMGTIDIGIRWRADPTERQRMLITGA